MRHQQDLQVQLRDRYRRLITSDHHHGAAEVALVVGWINQQKSLLAIIAEAEQASPEVDFDEFKVSVIERRERAIWRSESEADRVVFGWKLMSDVAAEYAQGRDRAEQYAFPYSRGEDLVDDWEALVKRVMEPFFDYLGEHLSAGSSVLHVLERYVRSVEWFRRDDLYPKFEADTRNGEEVYNLDLQAFLFQDGNYVTHAKARGISGEPDLIGDLATEDPLICDGKIFGPGRTQAYLAKGFHQVIKYAEDYKKNTAYLVIFNVTDRILEMPSDGKAGEWPPYVETGGVRVYFVVVRAAPSPTASKAGKARTVTIARENLFDPDAPDLDLDDAAEPGGEAT